MDLKGLQIQTFLKVKHGKTRAVGRSDYSPAIELSEEKDKLV